MGGKKNIGGIVSEKVFCERLGEEVTVAYHYPDGGYTGKQKVYQEPICPKFDIFDSSGLCDMRLKQNLACPYFINNRPKRTEGEEVPAQTLSLSAADMILERRIDKKIEEKMKKVHGEIDEYILEHSGPKIVN